MVTIQLYIAIFIGILVNAKAARILAIYPAPFISHQAAFRPITLELLKRGHQVTVVTPDPMFPKGNAPQNLTEIDVHDISYGILQKELTETVAGKKSDSLIQVKYFLEIFSKILEELMKAQEVKNVIFNQTEAYDLILLELHFTPALAISHKYNTPTILISSFGPPAGISEIMGVPTHPILYPTLNRQRIVNLTLWEKFIEIYNYFWIQIYVKEEEEQYNKIIKRVFWPDTPPITELRNYVDMLFLNLHPIWEGNFPVPPNVVYMGGLHQKPPKSLPQELQEYLDASDMGVIYFSFGTNVKPSLLPREKIAIFENVFAKLPYNIIWKWDSKNVQAKSPNVKLVKWAPQPDLLRHPNVKAFITQGGLQSTDEAITAEVPLIGIPMLADQWFNVEKYIQLKIGVRLDLEDITEDKLKNAIIEVVENKSYKNNIARLHSLMTDQPQQPLERTMWWIEYVLRHGGAKHLRAPSANISWAEFLQLDLIAFVIFIALIVVVLFIVTIRHIISHLIRNVRGEKLKTK